MAAAVQAILGQRPDLAVVKVADGTKDNWAFPTGALPDGVELIDFYAAEQLKGVSRLSDATTSQTRVVDISVM